MNEELKKDVESLFGKMDFVVKPDYMQIALGQLRKMDPEAVKPFEGLPDSAVIVLQKGKEPSVLVDENDNVLCFR